VTVLDFSFAQHARDFDRHIGDSIDGLPILHARCASRSRHYVQNGTTVVDIGCSTGNVLRAIRDENQAARPAASYVGIDIESSFGEQWRGRAADNVRFEVRDARSFEFENASLVISLFTLQFIPLRDRVPLLRRIHDGLIEGGSLIIAEKVLANDARFQDIGTFIYYDHKGRSGFSPEEILDKERSLRGQMVAVDEATVVGMLWDAGFEAIQRFWQVDSFLAFDAQKRISRRRRCLTLVCGVDRDHGSAGNADPVLEKGCAV
jgi:tRNA (cmo5U34)-methyltransferase